MRWIRLVSNRRAPRDALARPWRRLQRNTQKDRHPNAGGEGKGDGGIWMGRLLCRAGNRVPCRADSYFLGSGPLTYLWPEARVTPTPGLPLVLRRSCHPRQDVLREEGPRAVAVVAMRRLRRQPRNRCPRARLAPRGPAQPRRPRRPPPWRALVAVGPRVALGRRLGARGRRARVRRAAPRPPKHLLLVQVTQLPNWRCCREARAPPCQRPRGKHEGFRLAARCKHGNIVPLPPPPTPRAPPARGKRRRRALAASAV